MPQPEIGNHYCREVTEHCRRVAILARRAGACLPLTEPVRVAMEVAALAHEEWVPLVRRDLPADATRILETMARVALPPDDETALAAETLDACNTFDETLEFAAYDRTAIPDAIAAFHAEVGVTFRPEVRRALTQATAPVPRTTMPAKLPVMPRAAMQLMRTSDETTSPSQLQLIAGSDPVLCGSLLNAANSARFCMREPVSKVIDAAARLGIPAARKVLMAACFSPLFASKPLQDLWKHSQEIAAATAEAARRVSFDDGIAWTAGLLHDIGRLVLKTGPTEPRVKLLQWVESGFPLVYAENLTYGKDHAAVGADLLRKWNLPPVIADAVEYHHRPEQSDSVLASLLFLAEMFVDGGEGGKVPSDPQEEALAMQMRQLCAEQRSGFTLETFVNMEGKKELLAVAS